MKKKKVLIILLIMILLFGIFLFIRRRYPQKISQDIPSATGLCQVKSIEKIGEGAFPKISPNDQLIAFNKKLNDHYEIFTMKLDETNTTCLTCDKKALINTGHKGQPYWHPSGDYLVFTLENLDFPRKGVGVTSLPDVGRNHNVWIMSADGEKFWQITHYPENWGVIKPTFSHDGTKLFWNEEFMMEKYPQGKPNVDNHPGCYWGQANKLFRKGEELCAWRVKLADLSFPSGEPQISNPRYLNPPDDFTLIEAEGFIPDSQGFIYSYCDIQQEGGKCFWGDIYTSDLQGGSFQKLTNTPQVHDENAEYSPDGNKIVWSIATGGLPGEGVDLFIMNANGSHKARLTHFSEPGYPEYLSEKYRCEEIDWAKDGSWIVLGIGIGEDILQESNVLYKITFKGPCGKQ